MTRLAHRGTRRFAVIGGLLAGLVAATTAQAESPRHYTYAGTSGGYWFFDSLLQAQNSPAGRPAAFGIVRFVPARKVFTLRIDDAAVATGRSLPVTVYQDGIATGRDLCVRDGATLTLTGFRPNHEVSVFVVSAADEGPTDRRGCDALATAGSAYVGL